MSPYHGETTAWEDAIHRLETRFELKLKKLRKRVKKLEALLHPDQGGDRG